jgi:hypothetical protein
MPSWRAWRASASSAGSSSASRSLPAGRQAFGLEQAVGLADGHGVDGMPLGDGAHARQFGPRPELAAGDQPLHLLHHLAVDGRGHLRLDVEEGLGVRHVY